MRHGKLLIPAITLAALASLPLAAQQPGQPTPDTPPSSTQPDTASSPQSPSQQTAPSEPGAAVPTPGANEANGADLRPVSGELVSKLDTKNAKNGDPVVVKTTEKTTIGNGIVIPKGSKITGHVTDVQAHDSTNPNSKVAIQFDQAEIKGGQTMPIKSVLEDLAPATGSDTGQAGGGYGAAPRAPSPSGGGSAGGAVAPGSSATSQAPIESPTAGTTRTAAQPNPGGGTAPSGYPAAGTVVAHQGNVEIKTTSIPGVLIASAANGQPFSNASGALLGARQNIHLDGGTKVTLAIADANNKTGSIR